jgi:thiamine biosynthesis lipoprotein
MCNPQSTVARINGGDSTVERSAMFREIFELAKTVNKETNGAFDIHVAPLVNAWGFGFKHDQLPTPQQVDSLLKIRDQMDFSAIAKGYGCDVVARLLRSHGIENFMVEIGGEVVLSGHNDKGQPWHIGVNKPVENPEDGELQTVLSITDCAIATSGNYRNFYYKDGQRYAHTIDPRTGYPVQHSLLSATVVAADCATADAYATSFMVLGLDSAQAVLNSHPELKAYLIYSDESGQMSVWRSETLDCEL